MPCVLECRATWPYNRTVLWASLPWQSLLQTCPWHANEHGHRHYVSSITSTASVLRQKAYGDPTVCFVFTVWLAALVELQSATRQTDVMIFFFIIIKKLTSTSHKLFFFVCHNLKWSIPSTSTLLLRLHSDICAVSRSTYAVYHECLLLDCRVVIFLPYPWCCTQ